MSTPAEDLERAEAQNIHPWREPLLWGLALGFVVGLGVALIIVVAAIVGCGGGR